MSSLLPPDADAGRDFFRRGPFFVCILAPPQAGSARGNAVLAFAITAGPEHDALAEARAFASNAGGRHYAMVLERVALGTEEWPTREPPPALHYIVERDGYVVIAPSVTSWVHMPPARPHLLVQLVEAKPREGEGEARTALAALGSCGLVARVRALVHGDSGAEFDAVVAGSDGLRGGYFPPTTAPAVEVPLPAEDNDLRATAPPVAVADRKPALDPAVTACAGNYLWAQQPYVVWSDEFVAQYQQHLLSQHPGLTPAQLVALLAYGQWLCWHEGLGKP